MQDQFSRLFKQCDQIGQKLSNLEIFGKNFSVPVFSTWQNFEYNSINFVCVDRYLIFHFVKGQVIQNYPTGRTVNEKEIEDWSTGAIKPA